MTPDVAVRYGAAFGRWLLETGAAADPGSVVIVGRDSRTSGEILAASTLAGLRASGVAAMDAGIAPTPTILLAVRDHERAVGGVVITASHNPVEWNGLKLATGAGRFVTPAGGSEIHRLFETGPVLAGWDGLGGGGTLEGVAEHHIERVLSLDLIDVPAIRGRAVHVALDCVHGAGGAVLPELLRRLGCEVEGLGLATDGVFPRDPEPVPENLGELGRLVRSSGAEIGFAVDPDGDRLALVDGSGAAVGEDWTLALAAEYVLGTRTGPVVTNLSSSQSIERVAADAGVELYRSAVGEARVAEKMLATGAVVGGEGNGGVMLPDLNLTRDAAVAAALVLGLLARRGETLAELLGPRERFHMIKRKVSRGGLDPEQIYDRLRRAAPAGAEEVAEDGLRLTWPETREWLHVRPSGTEPILRLIGEAPTRGRAERLIGMAVQSVEGSAD